LHGTAAVQDKGDVGEVIFHRPVDYQLG
jgi:hypothetical protein